MQQNNRAFQEMLRPARERLFHRRPEDIAEKTGAVFDGDALRVCVLGRETFVSYPAFEPDPALDGWSALLLLHYLDLADGTPVCTGTVSFGGLREGLIRGTKFDRTAEEELGRFLDGMTPERVRAVCKELDATFTDARADLCAVFHVFPNYPLTVKFWWADDEFPASGKMLASASADHYLSIEDAVTAGEVLLNRLRQISQLF